MLLERLMRHTGLSRTQLDRYAESASKRYKVYQIPKRTGGFRTIEHPSREIKAIQRWIDGALIQRFPVHDCATAYCKGSSIRENASRHMQSNFTLRADFKSFFPSFAADHVTTFLRDKAVDFGIALSDEDISFVGRIVCRHEKLTIGAPSSPKLTNAMMFDFDSLIASWCHERSLVYTRYADDIFISSRVPDLLSEALAEIRAYAESYPYARLKLNDEKTAFLSRRYRRSVTGLVITPERRLSIGRDRKLRLKSELYKWAHELLPASEWARVAGMLAFVKDVEPTFYFTLTRKYGEATVKSLEAGGEKPRLVRAIGGKSA